ncbi:MAG: tetraacyldisaccharide 4'-kinase [Gammaproteobacteria bacterium]|nr:tetraacyldisaccharide 4'-kinase [Gammaproteobacteria bacterium]
MTGLENWFHRIWYGGSRWYFLLIPLSWIFSVVALVRAGLYHAGVLRTYDVGVPVIVVGNITVGGTGKTPLTIWLARVLQSKGYYPGIVSRGYGGKKDDHPVEVTPRSDPNQVGDEAILLATRSGCPVVVHADRIRAAQLARKLGARVLIADDGLQHYRLHRDFEIALVDGSRAFGNGHMLPAGPLREPISRLELVDEVLLQKTPGVFPNKFGNRSDDLVTSEFSLVPGSFRSLDDAKEVTLDEFAGKRVHAVAAISNPQRFFRLLESLHIDVDGHAFRDHAQFDQSDLEFEDGLPVVMTEKDAVKCRQFAREGLWYLPVEVDFGDSRNMIWVDELLRQLKLREQRPGR